MKFIVRASFIWAIVGSFISQIPSFVITGTGGYLKALWILPLGFILFCQRKTIIDKPLRPFYLFVLLFIAYCFVLQAFSIKHYIGTDITNLLIDLVILTISYKFWKSYRSKTILFCICLSMLICSVYLSYQVYYDFFVEQGVFSRQYVYASKNSLSIILFCAILFLIVTYTPKKLILKLIWWVSALFVLYVVVIMRSRSVLVGIAFVYFFFVVRSKNKKLQIATTIFALFYIYSHPSLLRYFMEGIIAAGKDYTDLDDFSSGRVHNIEEGWPLFLKNMHFGEMVKIS